MLCEGMPHQFLEYFKYCERLKFDQRPNYEYLLNLLEAVYKEQNPGADDEWDWVSHKKRLIEKRALREAEEKRAKDAKAHA
jgi:hypothetical protein